MRGAIAGVLTGLALLAAGPGEAAPELLTVTGSVDDIHQGKTGISFAIAGNDLSFVIDPAKTPNAKALLAAVHASDKDDTDITVTFSLDAGHLDALTARPAFTVWEIDSGDKTIQGDHALPSAASAANPHDRAAAALVHGVAYAAAGDDTRARAPLDQALSGDLLPPDAKVLALKTRGAVASDEALIWQMPGAARDKLLMTALSDDRGWQQLAPSNSDAALAVGDTLTYLGAYDDAIDVYHAAFRKWPDARFTAMTDIVYADLARGNPSMALDGVDEMNAVLGDQDGSTYHYYRGWALERLGRTDEAADEYTYALQASDYSWSYIRRACARAAMGQLPAALKDQIAGIKAYREGVDESNATPRYTYDIKQFNAVSAVLRGAIHADPNRKLPGLCDGYWDEGEGTRLRSALLGPAR